VFIFLSDPDPRTLTLNYGSGSEYLDIFVAIEKIMFK
jgi:hypothetical protein